MKNQTKEEMTFTSADELVRVIKTRQPARYPRHDFPVVMLRIKACRGTRVKRVAHDEIEWMPRWSEVAALCGALGVAFPKELKDKPDARRLQFERINAARHGRTFPQP